MNHAPIPWEVEYDNDTNGQWYRVGPAKVWFPFGASECEVDEAKANAEFIARACKSHYDLLAACRAILEDGTPWAPDTPAMNQIRAAIAKVTG